MIRFELEKAVYLAKSGRPGPVWLDIPLNIQAAQIDPQKLQGFRIPEQLDDQDRLAHLAAQVIELLNQSGRPVILAGHGIRLAKAIPGFQTLIRKLQIPVLTTWNAIDLLASDDELYAGRPGIYGQRGANFVIQNSDFLLSIGSRLSIPQIGYDYSQFARAAKKIYVDIDIKELEKFSISPDILVDASAGDFIEAMTNAAHQGFKPKDISVWKNQCQLWNKKYPVDLPEYEMQEKYVNIFHFISVLSDELSENEIILPTASGSGFTSSHQALKIKHGQRCFTSNGFAEMGFDVPGAIGACIGSDKKRVITVTGDGGVQMNIQEFQTIVHHQLPIKLFILNNRGYLTIRHTENALFDGQEAGTGPETGVSLPDILRLGDVYGFKTFRLPNHKHMRKTIRQILDTQGPVICEVIMDPLQALVPKTSFKQLPDGRLVSPPLEDLYPFLDRKEFLDNMIIPPIPMDE